MEEILNLEYHHKRMVLKALNSAPKVHCAAHLLGIDERRLYAWKKRFGIQRNKETKQYYLPEIKKPQGRNPRTVANQN